MKITKEQLIGIMPSLKNHPDRVNTFLPLLNKYMEEFGINTRLRVCHYLAQIAHESGELRYTKEIASGAAYDTGSLAIKLGNTPQKDGDGQKYKGRGLIQITGRTNYKAYSDYLVSTGMQVDLLKTPELLEKPLGATKSSMWFFATHGCLELADRDEIIAITRRINGGTNGLTNRKVYYQRAKLFIK